MSRRNQAIVLSGIMVILAILQFHWHWHQYAAGISQFPAVCQGLRILLVHFMTAL